MLLTSTKKSASQQCLGEGSCIRPELLPPPGLALGDTRLDAALIELKCELACVQRVSVAVEMHYNS